MLLMLFVSILSACTARAVRNNETDVGDNADENSGEEVTILDLPPLKEQFGEYFLMGNIFNVNLNNWDVLLHHFNAITAENIMKPAYVFPSRNAPNFTAAENFVNRANADGFKVIGHTLLWHSQIPAWQRNMANESRETALAAMREYITRYVSRFEGKIYSWDVLNEIFPDSGYGASSDWRQVMRSNNPWYASIGSDFIYEGFLAARLADPNAILYYNDYNTDQAGKATMIRDMVLAVNNRYLSSRDKPAGEDPNRLLIEGIGMQEHHNTNVHASAIRRTIDMFRAMEFTGSNRKIILSVSELDVLARAYSSAVEGHDRPPLAGNNLQLQAQRYGEYFRLYLENADIIERVTFWGVTDDQSWRSGAEPLIFDSQQRPKPAYFSIIEALPGN